MHGDPRILSSYSNKRFHSRLFLNATSGTHISFDKDTNVGEILFYKLVSTNIVLPSAAPLLRGYAKVETLTISKLDEFVITASSQTVEFLCKAKFSEFETSNGWYYFSSSKCYQKLQQGFTLHVQDYALR
ncbi:unnamed protein product [Eruca vesicaria subsp. sativa]|uniref:Uncharacterized protein n=1 Tax=Eruca vesicaria subsp. sativa TaxID=29727 RepID=A0ABC8M8D1_ERUVS|nr:unnamed protein product [Eruca vesicaria subsp. sativa]